MKSLHLALAMIAGVVIGATAVAQGARRPAYFVAEIEVVDWAGMKPYSAREASTVEAFGGRYVVRGGRIASLEGTPANGRLVVIAFDSMDRARAWYDSPGYGEIKAIRQISAISRAYIAEGAGRE